MGNWFQTLADAVVTPDPTLVWSRVNGMETVTGRTVFHPGQSGSISCPRCALVADWADVVDSAGTWYGVGDGLRRCAGCHRRVGLDDWLGGRRGPSAASGFGDWPRLRPEILTQVSDGLGRRVVHIADEP